MCAVCGTVLVTLTTDGSAIAYTMFLCVFFFFNPDEAACFNKVLGSRRDLRLKSKFLA